MPAPGQFLPRASHAHRVACKALYRSLLTFVPHIPLPPDLPPRGPVNPIKHLVCKKFKQNASLDSPKLIVGALKVGYLLNKLLASASQGHHSAMKQIHAHLHNNAAQVVQARELCTQPFPKPKRKPEPYPGAPKVLDVRPLPLEQLSSGRRTVPTLTSTQGIPFLRFKKKQSEFLGRVLRDKVKKKLKLSAALERMEDAWGWGVQEERWDASVRGEEGRGWDTGWEKGEGSWFEAYREEERRLWVEIGREQMKNKRVGDRMLEIVEKERELWEKERNERKERKWAEYLKRKEQKKKLEARNEN